MYITMLNITYMIYTTYIGPVVAYMQLLQVRERKFKEIFKIYQCDHFFCKEKELKISRSTSYIEKFEEEESSLDYFNLITVTGEQYTGDHCV